MTFNCLFTVCIYTVRHLIISNFLHFDSIFCFLLLVHLFLVGERIPDDITNESNARGSANTECNRVLVKVPNLWPNNTKLFLCTWKLELD